MMKERIQKDLEALAHESAAQLKTLDDTADALRRRRIGSMKTNHPKRGLKMLIAAGVVMFGGAVFAATAGDLFSFSVETDGKTDDQIRDEIEGQLQESGVEEAAVQLERTGDEVTVQVDGRRGDREFQIVRTTVGEDEGRVEMQEPAFDSEREPGMTDEALKAKIERQMQALGIEGTVTVQGDDIRIEARKEVVIEE